MANKKAYGCPEMTIVNMAIDVVLASMNVPDNDSAWPWENGGAKLV